MTMGVGKLKGTALSATINFFKAGIDVCLTQPGYAGFVRVLDQYLRLLSQGNVKSVSDYFQLKSESIDELKNVLEENDANGDKELEALLDFRNHLLGGKGRIKRIGNRKDNDDSDSENSSQNSPSTSTRNLNQQKVGGKNTKTGLLSQNLKIQGLRGKETNGKKRRQTSILESVNEEDEEEEAERGEREDDDDNNESSTFTKVKSSKVTAKAKKVPTLSQEGSRRSSRGEASKRISYSDEVEEEDEEEEGDEDEEEKEKMASSFQTLKLNTTSPRRSDSTLRTVYGNSRNSVKEQSFVKDNRNSNDIQSIEKIGRAQQREEQEEEEDEGEEEEEGDVLRNLPEVQRRTLLGSNSRSSSSSSSVGVHQKGNKSESKSKSKSRVDTVHLGLELEESVDWVDVQEAEEEEEAERRGGDRRIGKGGGRSNEMEGEGGGQGEGEEGDSGDDLFLAPTYDNKKRGREFTVQETEKYKDTKKIKENKEVVRPLPTRTSQRNQSQSQSTDNSSQSLSQEKLAGKSSGKDVVEEVKKVHDIFAGLNVPTRKRFR